MEAEPMPDEIVQQDIMLDDIKEYRKIISGLCSHLERNFQHSEECRTILNDFDLSRINHLIIIILDMIIFMQMFTKHTGNISSEMMDRIKNADNLNAKMQNVILL